MAATVFAAPILPGKTDAWKAAAAEIAGPRKQEYLQARRDLVITKEVAALQQSPQGDFVCVYIEASSVSGILEKMVAATDPFHVWFAQAVLKDCHGIEASGPIPPVSEPVLDLL